jgi:hypothetical protein
MERMTAEQAARREGRTTTGPVLPDRLIGIGAAARPEAAVPTQEGRKAHTIRVNEQEE